MSTPQQQPHLNTPPFGQSAGPEFQPQPLGTYTGQDFPAPPGVPPLGPPNGHAGEQSIGHADEQTVVLSGAPARTKRRGGVIVAAALAAVIGAGTGIGSYAWLTDGSAAVTGSPIRVTTETAANSPVQDGTISAAAQRIEPSVVTISVQAGQGSGIGTGVVLDQHGHILTNEHVVSQASQSQGEGQLGQGQPSGSAQVTVVFDDGTSEKATVVGTSETNDLAVIKVSATDKLVPATFAESTSLQVGQSVVAVGAPLGLADTVTSGIVSNTARPVRSGTANDAVYLAVQTDAAINPGNSGGPLVNLNGDVVGINSSIASTGSDGSGQSGNIGIGFAIPADVAVRVAHQLVEQGSYTNAALGVTVGGEDSQAVSTDGVVLQSVVADGAAAEAGLEVGDRVTRVNDFSTTTADGLIAATRFYAPGTAVEITYTRDGQTATTKATLESA